MQPVFSIDDVRASIATILLTGALMGFSFWYTININEEVRPSFIEVELGEFKTGSMTAFSELEEEEVATSPNSSDVETENTIDETPDLLEAEKPSTDADAKPVDLPNQIEDIDDQSLQTPQTKETDPTEIAEESTQDNISIAPIAQEDEITKEGAKESGDKKGATGETTTDQGLGNEEENTSPYELKWEGDLVRDRRMGSLPRNTANIEAIITVRFEVRPNGRVGRIIPIKKMSPELEREVMTTLRTWRFTQLPESAPQEIQWGSITFRFVFD